MALIRSHDALFRFVFGEPETMADLVRSQLPADAAACLDWRSMRRRDGSFVDAALLATPRGRDIVFARFSWFLAGAPRSHDILRRVMHRIDEENVLMSSALDLVLDMGHERGLKQGLQSGLEAFRAAVVALLTERFGPLPEPWQARVAAADGDALRGFCERLLHVASLDELARGTRGPAPG